jgi:hypothetical protein
MTYPLYTIEEFDKVRKERDEAREELAEEKQMHAVSKGANQLLRAEIKRLRDLVESAYREGRSDGYTYPADDTWPKSETNATLNGGKE